MIITTPYTPTLTEKWLNNYLTTNYYKKSYDRFKWWRSYSNIKKALTPRHCLKDRIMNGDFEFGPYKFEAQVVEHRMNKKYLELKDDSGRYIEETSLDRSRRKRLLEDYEKDEASKLVELRTGFINEFRMTKDEYDIEVSLTEGTILEFYFDMLEKYGTRIRFKKS